MGNTPKILVMTLVAWVAMATAVNAGEKLLDEKSRYLPTAAFKPYFIAQTAGYTGYVSGGLGAEIAGFWGSEITVGFVPPDVGGQELWSVNWKNTIGPYEIELLDGLRWRPLYIGATLLYSLDDDTFAELPGKYPDGYYRPTAFHLAPLAGTQMWYRGHALFVEVTCLDIYLEKYTFNPDYLELDELSTLGIGYRFYFGRDPLKVLAEISAGPAN